MGNQNINKELCDSRHKEISMLFLENECMKKKIPSNCFEHGRKKSQCKIRI